MDSVLFSLGSHALGDDVLGLLPFLVSCGSTGGEGLAGGG